MKTLESARLAVMQNPRQLRVVGPYGTQDMIVVEDRETGERRIIPNKRVLVAGNNIGVVFIDRRSGASDEYFARTTVSRIIEQMSEQVADRVG